jgi:hypothetical protein
MEKPRLILDNDTRVTFRNLGVSMWIGSIWLRYKSPGEQHGFPQTGTSTVVHRSEEVKVTLNNSVFWDITPCCLSKIN